MGQTKSDIWEKVKKSKWWIIGAAGVILLAVVLRIVFNPAIHYSKGEKLFDSGKFSAAAEQFSAAGDYKDAASKAKRATAALRHACIVRYFIFRRYGAVPPDGSALAVPYIIKKIAPCVQSPRASRL